MIILENNFHLSYPLLLKEMGNYMIPEITKMDVLFIRYLQMLRIIMSTMQVTQENSRWALYRSNAYPIRVLIIYSFHITKIQVIKF